MHVSPEVNIDQKLFEVEWLAISEFIFRVYCETHPKQPCHGREYDGIIKERQSIQRIAACGRGSVSSGFLKLRAGRWDVF
ncbi:hypothetical protein AB1L42_07380 [Thalassoglobus sp. JC818]|uniref:hypothetical protein n=1 Tax=Thalassoglobus sp. JC818 TaxID=3232136 RepID=UPI003459D5CD